MNTQDFRQVLTRDQNPTGYRLVELRLTDEAAIAIDEALNASRGLATIIDESDLQAFIKAETDLQDVQGQIIGSIDLFKRPYHNAHKLICAKEKEILAPLEAESTRLRAEMSRIYGERRRKEMEEKRQLDELAAQERLKAIRSDSEQEASQHNRTSANAQAIAATAVTVVPNLRIKLGWEATLQDPLKVMQTNPTLLEISLRRMNVQQEIKSLEEKGIVIDEHTIPGIKLSPKQSVNVRR